MKRVENRYSLTNRPCKGQNGSPRSQMVGMCVCFSQAQSQQQHGIGESPFKISCAPLCLIHNIHQSTRDPPVQMSSAIGSLCQPTRHRNRSIDSVVEALHSVLFTPTLLVLEVFNVAVKFVEVLPLLLELVLELLETKDIHVSRADGGCRCDTTYLSISF
jgi:hypothetical protein